MTALVHNQNSTETFGGSLHPRETQRPVPMLEGLGHAQAWLEAQRSLVCVLPGARRPALRTVSATLIGISAAGMQPCPTDSLHAGALKLLDVNMFGWPAHTGRPAVATAAECCYACADTPGCNIWNFCPLKGGCGTGCTAAKFGPTGTQEQARTSYVRPSPATACPWWSSQLSRPRCGTCCITRVHSFAVFTQLCSCCSALAGSQFRGC